MDTALDLKHVVHIFQDFLDHYPILFEEAPILDAMVEADPTNTPPKKKKRKGRHSRNPSSSSTGKASSTKGSKLRPSSSKVRSSSSKISMRKSKRAPKLMRSSSSESISVSDGKSEDALSKCTSMIVDDHAKDVVRRPTASEKRLRRLSLPSSHKGALIPKLSFKKKKEVAPEFKAPRMRNIVFGNEVESKDTIYQTGFAEKANAGDIGRKLVKKLSIEALDLKTSPDQVPSARDGDLFHIMEGLLNKDSETEEDQQETDENAMYLRMQGKTYYRVALAVKQDVKEFGPCIPHPPIFEKSDEFRSFLYTKRSPPLPVFLSPFLSTVFKWVNLVPLTFYHHY